MKWQKDYDKASAVVRKKMIEEMRDLQIEAERKDFLHNSREIKENDE